MKRALIAFGVLALGCGDPVGPAGGANPSGSLIASINTLSNTVDLYYPESDSLVSGAYVTGASPNDGLVTADGMLAVTCSMDDQVQLFSLGESGPATEVAQLPQGSNPYTLAEWEGKLFVTLLADSRIAQLDAATMEVERYLETAPYPSGITVSGDVVAVSHGYGTLDPIGQVSLVDPMAWSVTDTVETPQNAFEVASVESGELHVLTTVYQDDGMVTIVDNVTGEVRGEVELNATPSISATPRAWGCQWLIAMGDAGLIIYDATGVASTIDPGISATDAVLMDDLLYVADFSRDAIVVWDPAQQLALDTLFTGSGPIRLVSLPEQGAR
mgnify:CR=1 FL=1